MIFFGLFSLCNKQKEKDRLYQMPMFSKVISCLWSHENVGIAVHHWDWSLWLGDWNSFGVMDKCCRYVKTGNMFWETRVYIYQLVSVKVRSFYLYSFQRFLILWSNKIILSFHYTISSTKYLSKHLLSFQVCPASIMCKASSLTSPFSGGRRDSLSALKAVYLGLFTLWIVWKSNLRIYNIFYTIRTQFTS